MAEQPTMVIPGIGKVQYKYLSLVCLVFQNCLLILSIKYSRVHKASDGLPYLASTAVVMSELVKFMASLFLEYTFNTAPGESFSAKMKSELFNYDTLLLSVPGILYCIQNNLLFVAVSNLTVAVYQVSAQLKILTTAIFSMVMLSKKLSLYQGLSLVLLTGGVGIVQIAMNGSASQPGSEDMNHILGMGAILLACMLSGFAGVYFEKILKHGRSVSLYIRNVQLAFFGFTIGLLATFLNDGIMLQKKGFFQGYGVAVWVVIFTQACGGLLVAVVMKWADNILKGFATSISIVLSSLLSATLFGAQITLNFCFGAGLVVTAVYVYGKYPAKQPAQAAYEPVASKPEESVNPPTTAGVAAAISKA